MFTLGATGNMKVLYSYFMPVCSIVYSYFMPVCSIVYSYFMPVCSNVQTITPRCRGRPGALLHEAEGLVQ